VTLAKAAETALHPPPNERTLLLVDLGQDVGVYEGNDNIATDVDGADRVENLGIFEGDALRHLHHTEDDDQVGTASID
jgi:hypothetical protein